MSLVNNLCSWVKRYYYRFLGMKLRYLDEYLNWYVYLFKVKKDLEKYPAVKRVIRHLFFTDSRLTREELFDNNRKNKVETVDD